MPADQRALEREGWHRIAAQCPGHQVGMQHECRNDRLRRRHQPGQGVARPLRPENGRGPARRRQRRESVHPPRRHRGHDADRRQLRPDRRAQHLRARHGGRAAGRGGCAVFGVADAPQDLRSHRRRSRGAHAFAGRGGAVHGVRRDPGRPLLGAAPGRPDGAGRPVHHVRLGRPGRRGIGGPGRAVRRAAAEPRRGGLRGLDRGGLRPGAAARMARRGVLAGPAGWLATHPERRRTRRRARGGAPAPLPVRRRVMAGARHGRVVSLGVHIVDVLGRPVSHIPPGQGRLLLDEIRITAAGTAAGTSVDLAKLGADVIAMGAIGDDLLADFLTSALDSHGIDTRLLARKQGVQTSATILPIRANGERPALQAPRATSSRAEADIDLAAIETADVLHIGGPDVLGRFSGEPLLRVLEFARDEGITTTMDVLSARDASAWDRLRALLRYVQYFLPNDEQLTALTGIADLTDAAAAVLSLGTEAVLVSRGAAGAALITADQRTDLPAFPAHVVDTTGCGDACTAGFITGLLRGWPAEDAAWLAMAAASLVVTGLGSDAGIVDFDGTLDVLRRHAPDDVLGRVRV